MSTRRLIAIAFAAVAIAAPSCGGGGGGGGSSTHDICDCTPSQPVSKDYRDAAKHVPLPALPLHEIDVNAILSWRIPPTLPNNAPRTGKELQLFHIAHAFARDIRIVNSDCDLHIEIAQTTAPNASRMIIETPIDSEYCPVRRAVQGVLEQQGLALDSTQPGELVQPIPMEITGLAFLDDPHTRGSAFVATTWELHPAVVNVLPQ